MPRLPCSPGRRPAWVRTTKPPGPAPPVRFASDKTNLDYLSVVVSFLAVSATQRVRFRHGRMTETSAWLACGLNLNFDSIIPLCSLSLTN